MSRRLFITACVLALAALALVIGPAPAAAAGSNSYLDVSGDGASAPDIGNVVVTNDDNGRIAMRVSVGNQPALTGTSAILIAIDSDRNKLTGDSIGIDYLFGIDAVGFSFGKWNGSDFADFQYAPVQVSYSSGVSFTFDRKDIGSPPAFDFVVLAADMADGAAPTFDRAPEIGAWTYEVKITPPTVESARVSFAPSIPRAGKLFAATPGNVRLSNGDDVQPTGYTCRATLAGKPLQPAGVCAWRIPKNARGKRIVVTVTVEYEASRTEIKPWVFTVR